MFLGELGGPHVSRLPWVRKPRHELGVRTSRIELVPEGKGYVLRVGTSISVRATQPVETDVPVACGIPGYDHVGLELYAGEFVVEDAAVQLGARRELRVRDRLRLRVGVTPQRGV